MFRSDFLFSDTDFVTGMGSVLNIGGNYFEFDTSISENIADLKALRSDWGVTGQDIDAAYHECLKDNTHKETCC
ncbi:MAG: hypothetical protein JSU03_04280 [Bacteroidetes bacterium]|nr:hypothetical protein [Bacteroidota bacterium]MBS1756472.1 hypothetical protein [Bacteroidota bacterium]